MAPRAAGILACLVMAGTPTPARADCPADPALASAGLAEGAPPATRLRFLRAQLEVGARRTRIWSAVWGSAYGAALVAQVSAMPFVSDGTRKDLYVGASSALVGTVVRAFAVPRVVREHRRLERRLEEAPETCATVHVAERAMARSLKSERFGQSLLVRLGALVYNASIGVVLGVALDRPVSGIRQATIGATVGQLMIATQPTTVSKALLRYRRGDLSPRPPRYVQPLVLRGGGGFTIGGRF